MLYLSRDFNGERPGKHAGHVSATGVLPALFKIAMSAVAWFAAVVWLNLEGTHVDSRLAVVAGIFVVSLTLLLVFGSTPIDGRRCARAKG
jgi:hypothetical protein